jgi:hypothetical protein
MRISHGEQNFAGFAWQNPIHFEKAAGPWTDKLRDPHIIHVGDSYYLTATMTPCGGPEEYDPYKRYEGSSPGLRLYSTKDFINWKAESWIIKGDELPPTCPYKNQCWASELHHIGGKFYLVTYADNWRSGDAPDCYVGVADKVTGPYKHITRLKGAGCDVTLTTDDAGKVYAFMIGNGIRVQQVDLSRIEQDDIRLVGPVAKAVDTTYAKQGFWVDGWTEGPWCRRRAGKYYLFYAVHLFVRGGQPENQYYIDVSYADHPMGPWTQDKRPGIFWGGHGSVFDGPDGRWWYSYKNEKFAAAGEDFLCIDPLDFLPDGRVASGKPTPYNVLTRIDPDHTVTQIAAKPKPVPVYEPLPPVPPITLLPPVKSDYAAKRVGDWNFAAAADGTPLPLGSIQEGSLSLSNAAGFNFEVRSLARPTGPAILEHDGQRVLDTSGGNIFFPERPTPPRLNVNKNFSVWMRIMPIRSPGAQRQGLVADVGRWSLARGKDGRLTAEFGPHMRDVLGADAPLLENNKWYDVGMSFEGDADPEDLHTDIVKVYLNGRLVASSRGRGMFNSRGDFQIGSDWYDGNNKFEGLFAHVIFWDGVADDSEMASLSD